ncbi:dipeptidyl-peptidase 9 [Angomonas deanei]|uniref:Dipeptidyl peptidase IV (DPP IV) N-terminal region/Prolyl oligopeptidase family, putative n=1 Tax=Angomonas deanei TaxID=59799 RepID=A0A7G2C5X4_9TRYP|nr:dipeptidyl-peptidase 9 [Angomonas deanei]CAD2214541.1 Dipeptidyl peptidase IV (DPP IV) N-terminal region/Prolyl oligopeptidase family, putative [Angomonas deanei]|eukprot:EPY31153.1 dipeptidyl-peptidase 9 [Angomonas deanei]
MVALPSGKTPLRDNVLPSAERTSHMNYLAEEDGGLERMAYPRVGDANVLPLLLLYDRTTGEHRYIPPAALRAVAPWYEYLCRFGFKDGKTLYLSLLSRTQEQYVVVSCAFAGLPTLGDRSPQTILDEDKDTHGVSFTVEWAQTIPWAWVEIPSGRPIHFGKYYDFLVCHDTFEEGGRAYFHLFYRPAGGDKDSWAPLTQGDWNVTPTSLSVEEQEGTGITVVYFEANAHDRLVKQLYRVQLDSTAKHPCVFSASTITPISPEREHVYCYCNTTKGVYYLSSTAVTPPQLHFYTEADRAVVPLDDWMLPDGKTPTSQHSPHTGLPPGTPLVIPSSVTVHNKKGVPLSANVFIPTSYQEHDKSQKLPLVLYVYGGPHVQLVHQHEYYAPYNAILQSALQGGIAAAVVDNSMSNANGLRDLSVCKNNMGHFETDDYVTVVKYLTSNPVLQHANVELRVDPERIAIFGWSYGGYSTLLAMSQAASVFKLGLAGAPVGDWRLYDTGYTERYLGLLTEEEETGVTEESVTVPVRPAYLQSAIAAHVKGFPEELNRLYIAHGLLDENVHFVNTCSVIEALIQEGKPFNMIVYPGERHGLRQKKESRLHHDGHLLKVLHDLL